MGAENGRFRPHSFFQFIVLIVVLTAVGMALGAVGPVVTTHLLMLVVHALLIVAGRTGIRPGVAARMACRTISIGPLMVDGERMGKRRVSPGAGVVAVGALPLEVVRRPCVAALAVCQAGVVKRNVVEVTRVRMAVATRTRKMITRRLVTRRAIRAANGAVIEASVAEIARVCVAIAARPLEMVGRRLMAGRAVRIANGAVTKAGVAEIARVRVAGAARSLEVVGRWVMAG